jgi:hypothetical protein
MVAETHSRRLECRGLRTLSLSKGLDVNLSFGELVSENADHHLFTRAWISMWNRRIPRLPRPPPYNRPDLVPREPPAEQGRLTRPTIPGSAAPNAVLTASVSVLQTRTICARFACGKASGWLCMELSVNPSASPLMNANAGIFACA